MLWGVLGRCVDTNIWCVFFRLHLTTLADAKSTVFASPQANDICAPIPGACTVSTPLATWGDGTYSTADMTTYDNLTTSVTPIMVTLLTNRTTNNTQASQEFTAQQLMCLRPSNIQAGSVSPTQIPNDGGRAALISVWAVLAAFILIFSLTAT